MSGGTTPSTRRMTKNGAPSGPASGSSHTVGGTGTPERRPTSSIARNCRGSHTFWDTEIYVLPVLIYTYPKAAAHALAWRELTLPLALERAKQLDLEGAAFPWRTIRGHECSAYWPALSSWRGVGIVECWRE